jgi:hypothetical protein
VAPRSPFRFEPKWALILVGFFALSLAPRLYGGLTFGADLDGPGTFRIVNYDEGGSCRAILGDFTYPTFVGRQVVAIASLLGYGPPDWAFGGQRAKAYCQSRPLIVIQRAYSAVTGALTVVLVGFLALMMWPSRPQIAWTACALLGFSNFHVAHSHSGTVDAPQVFFIYLFTVVLLWGLVSEKKWPLLLSPFFLAGAVWTKWYVFAVFAYAAFLPKLSSKQQALRYAAGLLVALVTVVLLIGWEDISADFLRRSPNLIWGNETGRFGTGYGNIGTWRRWIRNGVNLPLVHIMGFGLPACFFLWSGLKQALSDRENRRLWLAFAPAVAFGLYMLVLGPVTYYRHYLPLFPAVALLAACGLWHSRWSSRKPFLVLFFLYPLLLTADSQYNYRFDPRRELRPWSATRQDQRVYFTYYVVPPGNLSSLKLFNPDGYIRYGERYLSAADYLILSENWYDTSYPNELNGPIAWNPKWLIKTKPAYVTMYRRILSGRDANLELEAEFNLTHIMPEFLVHRLFYGSFQLFIGDLKIYRIVRKQRPSGGGIPGG